MTEPTGRTVRGANSAGSDANGRRAILALAVAAIGTVGFVIGLRAAMRRLPPEPVAGAGRADSVAAHRFAPPPPNQPDGYPRLR